jgi:hypothetical protein
MKHTPGQWKAIITGDQSQILYKGLICLIEHSPDNYISVVQADGRVVESDEWEANARLIAAAPELLEAVKLALPILRQYTAENAGYPIAETIENAIAKAEGKLE